MSHSSPIIVTKLYNGIKLLLIFLKMDHKLVLKQLICKIYSRKKYDQLQKIFFKVQILWGDEEK